jgi:YVTN family beta-propeller protein
VIDGQTNNVLSTIPVGRRPIPLLWNPITNDLYCGNSGDDSISIIDAHADTVMTTVSADHGVWALVLNSADNKVYCANFFSDNITVVDGVSHEVIKTIDLSINARPYTFAYNSINNNVYCANVIGNSISIIDGSTDSVLKTVLIPGGPFSLLYNSITNKLFCAYVDASFPWNEALAVIDGVSDSIITTFPLNAQIWYYGLGSPQKALAFDSLRNVVYYCHYHASKISVIDGETGIYESTYNTTPAGSFLTVWPNPAKRSVRILYSLSGAADAQLAIYDISGRLVKNLVCPASQESVSNQVIWDGTDNTAHMVAAGVYFARMETPYRAETRKFILLR